MTNSISQRNQSEQFKLVSGFKSEANAIKNKLQSVGALTLIKDTLNAQALADAKVANQLQVDNLNQQYIKATQNVLNDKALDFLVKNSMIDAPTLTSIVAGFELARASRADKLNEERQFRVDSITNQTRVAEELAKVNSDVNEVQRGLAADVANAEQQDNRTTFGQESIAARADVADQEVRDADVRRNTQTAIDRDADQQDRLEQIRLTNEGRVSKDTRTEAERFAQLGLTQSSTTTSVTPVTNQPVTAVNPASTNPLVSTQPVQPVNQTPQLQITPSQAENQGTLPQSVGQPTGQLQGQELNQLNDVTRQLLVLPDTPLTDPNRLTGVPVSPDELTDVQKQIAIKLDELGLQDDVITREEKNRIQFLRQEREGEVIPFDADRFSTSDPSVQRDLLNERYKVLIQDIKNRPLADSVVDPSIDVAPVEVIPNEPVQFSQDVIEYIDGINEAESDTNINILELQSALSGRGLEVSNLTPEEIQKLIDEDGQEIVPGESQ